MKKFILLALFLASLLSFSQQETIAKFITVDATRDGVDVSEAYVETDSYLVFYTSSADDNIYMANVAGTMNTQSFGRLFAFETEKTIETDESYEYDLYNYKWSYINNYNDKSGTAIVSFMKIYKPQGTAFICRIVTEDLTVLEYKGYMDGTL